MRVYKGFNKKIQAKHGKGTFQYEKGKTYKEEKSKTRSTGFHAAEYILDCLQWYPIDGKNKFFLCEAGGSIDEEDGCSMVVSTELTLLRELTLMEIAMAAMEYMIVHPKRTWEKRERGAYAEKERSKAIGETKIAIARGKHPEVKGEYGTVIGLICGFVGAGGGMMMLLILTSVLGYELKTAVGTSVFIMTFTALTGAASHFYLGGMPDVKILLMCMLSTLFFARVAAVFANKASAKTLNRALGIVLTVLGAVIILVKLVQ